MSESKSQYFTCLSKNVDKTAAIEELLEKVSSEFTTSIDLVFFFFSPSFTESLKAKLPAISEKLQTKNILGCSAQAVISAPEEVWDEEAISLWVGHLPNTNINSFHLEFDPKADGGAFLGWPDDLPETWSKDTTMFLLGDPFSFPADGLAGRLNESQPGIPMIGGMASGGMNPGECFVLLGDRLYQNGAVCALLQSGVPITAVVSQGCQPIGDHFIVTKCEQNTIYELSGKPAYVQLQTLFESMTPEQQAASAQGLHMGLVVDEYQEKFERGDFLIRNIIGADLNEGTLSIGDFVRVGQTVQFQLRASDTASEDLQDLVSQVESNHAKGCLLFSCNGRGHQMFELPNHDSSTIQSAHANIPVAGFFAMGEIGPVSKQNFMHGYTASMAFFG